MDVLIKDQTELREKIKTLKTNFGKDSASRKTPEYIKTKLQQLDDLISIYQSNNDLLQVYKSTNHEYFTENIYENVLTSYKMLRLSITKSGQENESVKEDKATEPSGLVFEYLSQQRTNFRAFSRLVRSIRLDEISDKWELEDELKSIQLRWKGIDELHLKIDNILQGDDDSYEDEFEIYEQTYRDIKRKLNQKISSTVHKEQSTPKLEVPKFYGEYTEWPTFHDLFDEAIHSNNTLTKAQKMQHLKGKVKGQAGRLIKHLHTSADNYDSAWEILKQRYSNRQVLFTNNIETFINQPSIQKQSAFELKNLHDTTMECIHAIHNLGVDTSTWDPLLVHLLTKKLDTKTYSEYKEAREKPRDLQSFSEFMSFLELKFTALEPVHQAVQEKERASSSSTLPKKQPYHINPNNANKGFSNYHNKSKPFYQANIGNTRKCPFCNHEHELYRCKQFLALTPENKLKAITKHNVCGNCLYKHFDNACTSAKRCKECQGAHNTILHEACIKNLSISKTNLIPPPLPLENTKYQEKRHNVNHVSGDGEEILLTTLMLKVRAADGTYVTLNALCDQGSQISIITQAAAQMLGLKRRPYHASVSGIGTGARPSKGLVNMECRSIYEDYHFTTQALVLSKVISNNLPTMSISKQTWPHLQNIRLADPQYNVSKPIDILLDASVYSDIIMSGLIKGPAYAPIAQQTKLGWILSGNVKNFNCHVVINDLAEISRFWEMEDVESTSSVMNEQEKYCEDFYQATTRRLESGRYEIGLPMKPGFEKYLGSSKPKAIAQLKQLEHKMTKNQAFAESYKAFLDEYEKLGHMRRVSTSSKDPTCYLPHHGVWKMDSNTTKLRVVFNGSSRTSTGWTLNQLMEGGPNLQGDLQKLILTWRTYKYVITADAEKYFRQIIIRESDQPLQSIVWRPSPQVPIEEYRLTTITYGTKAAPFLAIRTLKQLAKDDGDKYPLAAHALENSFYMDDLLGGHNLLDQTKQLQQQLIEILKGAGINLRKWSSNNPDLIKDLASDQLDSHLDFKCSETRKTLGLRWNPSSDTFTFQNKMEYETSKGGQTKRQLLSDISKIFDPLGWLSPLSIRAKLLFQKAWASGISWDDEVSSEIIEEWNQLRNDFKNISVFSIKRHYGNTSQPYQLHGFCDATPKCYACTIFVITRNNKGELTSRLVAAKTRLAPLKKQVSLPRLELCSAHLLSQLMKKVVEALPMEQCKIYAWTDAMIVLGWLQGDVSRWKQFVANRVQNITQIIPASNWRHVRSEENPADCATRGLTTKQLSEHSQWWQGPDWLVNDEPIPDIKYPETTIESKKQKAVVAVTTKQTEVSIIKQLMCEHSSITFVAKVISCMKRFITSFADKQNAAKAKPSRATEINNALNLIIKNYQFDEFEEDIKSIMKKGRVQTKSNLACLNPFLDEQGILRVGGRLKHSNISMAAKHPIILSSHSRLTELIIRQAHMTTLHGGPRLTLTYIRDKYWIISGIRTVKRQLRQCVICRRASSEKTQQQIMADLPQPRVTPSRPFTHCGVDFTGHVYLKTNKGRGVKTTKGYVAVFVCLATKAVHLELVSDLSTPAFLAAFHRFRARRATPQHMYSDNGTNFVGCNRLLKSEYQEIKQSLNKDLFNKIEEMNIVWHFNCPAHSNAGGIWESAVKSLKRHLKRVLGEQKLAFEEFTTLLCQIEACLNSRPLCAITESTDDECLTPGHFLVGGSLLSRPQTDTESINLGKRWQLVQAMNKQFWKSWSSEYLQQLQTRSKWRTPQKNLQVDDVVVIKDDNMAPGKFVLGRVLELHPGKDGYVRVVTLKTQGNILKRPVNKLILLPVNESDEAQKQQAVSQFDVQSSSSAMPQAPQRSTIPSTRCRRTKKKFINIFGTMLLLIMTFLTPSMQQDHIASYNTTSFKDSQGLYFDKISNLQFIRDKWKLVVYYNMSTYWQGIQDIKQYVNHIKKFSTASNSQYESVTLQLEHEIDEIEHYNTLLRTHSRRKRGLINGVGYIANTLFGVLDERFAEQYESDIKKIASNENHLQDLLKNQTLIIESESNILRRNENIMNKQFSFIRQRLLNVSSEINRVRLDNNNANYITSSSLAASIILTNIRNIQQSLINTVTDISQGHIDTRLLAPEQLENQINKISSQLQADLILPIEKTPIQNLYKLLRVFTKVYNNLLIIEINIPLLSKELYELDKIISIPLKKDIKSFYIYPTLPYLAFDLQKDMGMLLSESDLQSCLHTSMGRTLCSLEKPIYDMKFRQSLCDVSSCTSELLPTCKVRWVKLHYHNQWLYSCCEQCSVRIFCPSVVNVITLKGNGIITIGQGCTIKTNTFAIYAQNNFLSNLYVQQNIKIPEISILNKIINSSIGTENNSSLQDSKEDIWEQLKLKIDYLKEQSNQELSIHDKHHYTLIYVVIFTILAAGSVGICWKIKKGAKSPPQHRSTAQSEINDAPDKINSVNSVNSELNPKLHVLSENKATSPIVSRAKIFEL